MLGLAAALNHACLRLRGAESPPRTAQNDRPGRHGIAEVPADQSADKCDASGKPAKAARKIIYDARIDLVVDSLNATEQAISRLIKEHDGFLAESDQSSPAQNQRRATWRVRVPVDAF